MAINIGINGFGRIGRLVFRSAINNDDFNVISINDLLDINHLAYLLKYDSVHGTFDGSVEISENKLIVNGKTVRITAEKDPSNIDWSGMGVDIVAECTGIFTSIETASSHINSGAKKVVISAPSPDAPMFVMGVNHKDSKSSDLIVSNASCTTNCLAPMAKVLNDNFGIELGVINTIHAYTNDQRLADVPHSDWRRSRAAAENVIPTTTGAARAVGKVLPELDGKLDGIAMRVPVPDGSVVDLNVRLNQDVTIDMINESVLAASKDDSMSGVLEYSNLPVVSTDIIGNKHSSIFDAPFTRVIDKTFVKTLNWYDNEWGYSNRVVDLMSLLGKLL